MTSSKLRALGARHSNADSLGQAILTRGNLPSISTAMNDTNRRSVSTARSSGRQNLVLTPQRRSISSRERY